MELELQFGVWFKILGFGSVPKINFDSSLVLTNQNWHHSSNPPNQVTAQHWLKLPDANGIKGAKNASSGSPLVILTALVVSIPHVLM
jgi:hypothetical protein